MIIRQTTHEDLDIISALYNYRKSREELRWVFTNPETGSLDSVVAVDNNNTITGVIGYEVATYQIDERSFTGVMPMSWMVDKNSPGLTGINLFRHVTRQSTLLRAIGGSDDAKGIYPVFKLTRCGELNYYYKMFRPVGYFRSLESSLVKRAGNMILNLPGFISPTRCDTRDLEMIPYSDNLLPAESPSVPGIVSRKLTSSYFNWILRCPLHDSWVFHIIYNGRYMGEIILFRANLNGIFRGRLVHISHLGYDPDPWIKVISWAERFMMEKKCVSLNAAGHTPVIKAVLRMMNYFKNTHHTKPVYIRQSDPIVSESEIAGWHIQFTESDKSYRNI